MTELRTVCVLGSTGSIGTQAIDVAQHAPDRFRVTALAAGGGNPKLLAEQAAGLRVEAVGVSDPAAAAELTARLAELWPADAPPPKLLAGPDAVAELAAVDVDVVLNAVAGAQGLRATLAALDAGRTIALANKESLVAGGPLVTSRAAPGQLIPVDSEHSALAQCLRAGTSAEVRKLIVTASGGPFRGRTREQLRDVTPQQALAHPTWDMGKLITTNSATLVNKGLEVIEAHLLFDIPYERIEVVVHPQSVVHSMVEFTDGATIAKASPPDMRLPIALALGWPERVVDAAAPVDWTRAQQWTFEPLDDEAFPAVALARRVGEAGGWAPAVYNAANEELVAAFHAGAIGFLQIVDTIADVVDEWLRNEHASAVSPGTVEDVERAQAWARERARVLAVNRSG
ncbi:MAG TPA: 1-deoxy-D-xylulose-5-phosphate reductoisomerase [Jatrophihabitantaceae bacterium]|nr:1-deoxy-D-xylulose-5-phosphate reductoisomerase [Jatrophihabitantaceae bacterium]